MLDQQIPAGLWLNLVALEDDGAVPHHNSAQWVHTKHLPVAVEACAFPAWAEAFVFDKAADIVADFLSGSRVMESSWSTALSKASLVPEEKEEEVKKKKTKKQSARVTRCSKKKSDKNEKKRNREVGGVQETKVTAELAAYRRQEERATLKKAWEAERKAGDDRIAVELEGLRRQKVEAEIRKEVKSEFKIKKAKLPWPSRSTTSRRANQLSAKSS